MVFTYTLAAMVGLFTAAAAATDIRSQKIPNLLTVPAAILGLVFHVIHGFLVPEAYGFGGGIGFALAGFAVGFVLLLIPALLGGGGMGDIKLLAALGAWLGPMYILFAFGASAVFASMMAISVLIWSALNRGLTTTKETYLIRGNTDLEEGDAPRPRSRVLPYAVPVALGTWLVLSWLLLRGHL